MSGRRKRGLHYGEAHESERARKSCGKTRYRTRGIAEQARRRLEGHQGDELKVYGCPDCGGHHLTSQSTMTVRFPNRELPGL